jgi:hypothetical protein
MVTAPAWPEYRTRLTGLLVHKFFPARHAAKGKDETQALTEGLYKERTRVGIASQRP